MGKYPDDEITDGPGSIHTTNGLIVEGEFKRALPWRRSLLLPKRRFVIVKTFDRGTLVSERTAFSAPPNDTPLNFPANGTTNGGFSLAGKE